MNQVIVVLLPVIILTILVLMMGAWTCRSITTHQENIAALKGLLTGALSILLLLLAVNLTAWLVRSSDSPNVELTGGALAPSSDRRERG